MIIGIAGKKGSGKTTLANMLCYRKYYSRAAFADPLKLMLRSLLLDVGLTEGSWHYHSVLNKEDEIYQLGVSYRHLAQTLGTEWGRDMVCQNLWEICAESKIRELHAEGHSIVFDDVRFESEAAMIRSKGGVIVHVRRQPHAIDYHASEAGIDVMEKDLVLDNNGSIDDAFSRLDGFMGWVGE